MQDHVAFPDNAPRERRRSRRRPVAVAAEVRLVSETVPLQTTDVSAHGVFVRSAHVAPVRAALHLVLHLPDGPLESVATVIRALPGVGMGCHISIPGAQERRRWQAHLDSLSPGELVLDDVVLDHPRDLFDFTWSNEHDPLSPS
jgi:hypothetical protein